MVPTVVVGLLQHLAAHNTALRSLKRLVIGGAAAPRSMIETLERCVISAFAVAWFWQLTRGRTVACVAGKTSSDATHMHVCTQYSTAHFAGDISFKLPLCRLS
jgi:hypothetical protein